MTGASELSASVDTGVEAHAFDTGERARASSWPALAVVGRTRACDLLALCLCAVAFVAGAWVATDVFDRTPHVEDEVAFLFQAKTLAGGDIVARAPERPEFFFAPFIVHRDGVWFGKYPPGFPILLALGVLVGQAWLVNPAFAAGCIGLLYFAGRRLYGPATGLLAALLLVSSPFFLLQSGSLMSHVTSLFWTLLALVLFDIARRNGYWLAALGCGVSLGMLFLSRPLTGVGIGLPFALWMLVSALRDSRQWSRWLLAGAGTLPFVALMLLYNNHTTGDPFKTGYELWWPYDRIGFGEGVARDGNFTFTEALQNTRDNSRELTRYLFGWPRRLSVVPALLAVVALAVRLVRARGWSGMRAFRMPALWDLFQITTALSLAAAYLAYWSDGQMYGPRYYFEAVGALSLLSARGILQLGSVLGALCARVMPARAHPQSAGTVLALTLTLLLVGSSLRGFTPQALDRFTGWYDIDRSGVRTVESANPRNAVVFVPMEQWTDYAPFFSANSPTLDSDVVYAVDRGWFDNRALMASYPGRTAWRFRDGRLVRE